MEKTDDIMTVSEIVKKDYRTADVFKKWGINYCCGGNSSLEDVCRVQQLDKNVIDLEIEKATKNVFLPSGLRYDEWSIDFLVDYIINVHHVYIQNTLPALKNTISVFVQGHTKKYPYLQQVAEVFEDLAEELVEHTKKEEENIFPYLRQINHTYKRKEVYGSLFVRTLSKPLEQLLDADQRRISALLMQLRKNTNNYIFAENACTNHQVIYHKLKEFDTDLVQHKHLENNILYPKILSMEKELLKQ